MNTSDLSIQMAELQLSILKNDYYISLYLAALGKYGMSTAGITLKEYTDRQIAAVCHSFWGWLPDTPAIRREPFFALCELAEHVFDDGDDQ